jgi:hypothetical protein
VALAVRAEVKVALMAVEGPQLEPRAAMEALLAVTVLTRLRAASSWVQVLVGSLRQLAVQPVQSWFRLLKQWGMVVRLAAGAGVEQPQPGLRLAVPPAYQPQEGSLAGPGIPLVLELADLVLQKRVSQLVRAAEFLGAPVLEERARAVLALACSIEFHSRGTQR